MCCRCFGALDDTPPTTEAKATATTSSMRLDNLPAAAPTPPPVPRHAHPPRHAVAHPPVPEVPATGMHLCPKCGYGMDPFDRECSRCAREAATAKATPVDERAPAQATEETRRKAVRTLLRVAFVLLLAPFWGRILWSVCSGGGTQTGPSPREVVANPGAYIGRQVRWEATLEGAGREAVFGPWANSYNGYTFHAISRADDGSSDDVYVLARDVTYSSGGKPREGLRYLVKGKIEGASNDSAPLSLFLGVSGRVYLTDCAIVRR